MARDIYKVTVLGWEKHNSKKRKGHEYILLSTRFFDDAKIRMLPQGGRLLYLGLLLRCGDVSSNSVECSHDVLVMLAGGRGHVVTRLLDQLQEIQLVTYQKMPSLIIKNVIKNINKNVKENNSRPILKTVEPEAQESFVPEPKKDPRPAAPTAPDGTHEVIARYCELWKELYKGQAPIGGKVAGQFKTLVKDHGRSKALEFVEAFMFMKDPHFVSRRHDVMTLMANLTVVAHFQHTGKLITKSDIRRMDVSNTNQETLRAIQAGEI